MLTNAPNQLTFTQRIERYLTETLHAPLRVEPRPAPASQPVFIGRAYDFYEAEILGRNCLLMAPKDKPATPADIAKHVKLAERDYSGLVIFAAEAMSAHNRARLIGHGVPFVVPGNQLYVPAFALDLREHFRKRKERANDALSPAAQAVLFHHLLRRDEAARTPSAIAKDLNYSAMTIGRAFDDLTAVKLARTVRHGREKYIEFNEKPRVLLDAAKTLLRTPVRAVKYIRITNIYPDLMRAGETALAALTDLSAPRVETLAAPASHWKVIADTFSFEEVGEDEADYAIETWAYDPAGLSDGPIVDPFSLYAQFWDHPDERIAMAAEKLLETLPW